jgi:O-antigen/teichoic acid export membrane protein
MKVWLQKLARSAGMRHGLIMSAAMVLAGGLDYAVNVLAGRWLVPVEYGIFISVAAILQVVLYISIAIRNVVAFYTAELTVQPDSGNRVGGLVRRGWRWGWRWGLVVTALMAIISPSLAHLLRLPSAWPLWAASLMVFVLFLRPITDGTLQGMQAFTGLGLVQVTQAVVRLILAVALISMGWQAVGAILALPLAGAVALGVALWFLRPQLRSTREVNDRPVSWHYSAYTLLGMAGFALLTNLDALFVKRFFSPEIAGNYGPVVTLAKISLFLPLAIGMVLFPKAAQRQATGRDARPIVLLALAATLLPGLSLTTLYFLLPGVVVKTVFTGAYTNPGIVLGLANLAASLYAGLNIWLNYALSLNRPLFSYLLVGVLVWQGLGMFLFGRDSLVHMTLVMVSAALIGNLGGFVTTWFTVATPRLAVASTSEVDRTTSRLSHDAIDDDDPAPRSARLYGGRA